MKSMCCNLVPTYETDERSLSKKDAAEHPEASTNTTLVDRLNKGVLYNSSGVWPDFKTTGRQPEGSNRCCNRQ